MINTKSYDFITQPYLNNNEKIKINTAKMNLIYKFKNNMIFNEDNFVEIKKKEEDNDDVIY